MSYLNEVYPKNRIISNSKNTTSSNKEGKNKAKIYGLSDYSNIKGFLLKNETVQRIHINGSDIIDYADEKMKKMYGLTTADIKEVTWLGKYLNKWIFEKTDSLKRFYNYNSSYSEDFGKDKNSSKGLISYSWASIRVFAKRKTMKRLRKVLNTNFEKSIEQKYKAQVSLPDVDVKVTELIDFNVDNDSYINNEYSVKIKKIREKSFSIFYNVLGKVEFKWIPYDANGLSGTPVIIPMEIEFTIERRVLRKTN